MKKINESQLAARVNGLRDYLAQLDEAGPYTAGKPVAPATGNSFDAKLNALGKPATTAAAPQSHWWDSFGKSQRTVAAQKDMNAAKKPTAVAHTKPAVTPSAQAAPVTAPVTAPTAEPAAPAVNNGPWPAGSPQADAYSKMSPEDQKWLGGADPLDPMILARAPNGGKPAVTASAQITPAAAPTAAAAVPGVKAGGEVVDTRGGVAGQDEMEESATVSYSEDQSLARIMQIANHRR